MTIAIGKRRLVISRPFQIILHEDLGDTVTEPASYKRLEQWRELDDVRRSRARWESAAAFHGAMLR